MDEHMREAENKEFKMKDKAIVDTAVKRIRTYDSNKIKAYSLLWGQCSKLMKSQIQQKKKFNDKVYNDLIKLLRGVLHDEN